MKTIILYFKIIFKKPYLPRKNIIILETQLLTLLSILYQDLHIFNIILKKFRSLKITLGLKKKNQLIKLEQKFKMDFQIIMLLILIHILLLLMILKKMEKLLKLYHIILLIIILFILIILRILN